MQANFSDNVSSHVFFPQGLTRSLLIFAEAASRRVLGRNVIASSQNTDQLNQDSEPSLLQADVLDKIQQVVDLQRTQHVLLPDWFQTKTPQSEVVCGSASSRTHDIITSSNERSLRLAAHSPYLPRRASPLSSRDKQVSPYRHLQASHNPCLMSDNGYTQSSLRLIKWHWEYRYEHWFNSLSASGISCDKKDSDVNSSFNPALFPRAGSLVRPLNDPGSLALTDRDWALRHWSMNKIFRTLFLHDLSQRLASYHSCPNDHSTSLARPWERDWALKWKVIEDIMLSGNESLQRYRDDLLNDSTAFDEDTIMQDILGEDRMDVDECSSA